MPYVAFREYFPEIADQETRVVTILRDSPQGPPPGDYILYEMYCDEPGCDCRRVFFNVLSVVRKEFVAAIAFGWEPAEFYSRWMGDGDPQTTRELKGPVLNLFSRQSDIAPAILVTVEELVLSDEAYIDRLKRHYKMFREQVGSVAKESPHSTSQEKGDFTGKRELIGPTRSRKVGRNRACPCGSGKKYKRCCGRV